MLKNREKKIILLMIAAIFIFSSIALAVEIPVGDSQARLSEEWKVFEWENREELLNEYTFLGNPGQFNRFILKTGNYDSYKEAEESKDYEKVTEVYPAFIALRKTTYDQNEDIDNLMSQIVGQIKSSSEKIHENIELIGDKTLDVDGMPGHRIDYKLGHMEFKNVVYATDNHNIFLLMSTSTQVQQANQEIEDFFNQLVE